MSFGITLDKATDSSVVPSSTDNNPLMTHVVCILCHPVNYLGMPAFCGEKLLGVPPVEGGEDCEECHTLTECLSCGCGPWGF